MNIATPDQIQAARRDLHREMLVNFGEKLPWLIDPSIIPEHAVEENLIPDQPADRYSNLSNWMLLQVAGWAREHQPKLNYLAAFESHGLHTGADRVAVRQQIVDPSVVVKSYRPGMEAMAEIIAPVPAVATRHNIALDQWGTVASNSRQLGRQIATRGTELQAGITGVLMQQPATKPHRFDNRNLTLDAKSNGLTTTTPIKRLIEATMQVINDLEIPTHQEGVCIVLQAKSPHPHEPYMFDAFWSAYTHGANTYIFPKENIDESCLQPENAPLDDPYNVILALATAANVKADAIKAMTRSGINS